LYSALEFTREVLEGIGLDASEAKNSVEMFRAQDSKLLDQQTAIMNDQRSLIQSTHDAAAELSTLLAQETGR